MRSAWALLLATFQVLGKVGAVFDINNYHSHAELTDVLMDLNRTYSNLTNLYSIGKSSTGKELWVLEISAGETRDLVRPNVKLIGNIHGNEPVGRELLLYLSKYLLEMYNQDKHLTRLLSFARVHILPSLNPDGFEKSMAFSNPGDSPDCVSGPGRRNYNNVDLNRDFPDRFGPSNEPMQSETTAVIRWLDDIPFVLSASLHSGALLAVYPYDNTEQNDHGEIVGDLAPDDDVFQHLASVYANAHPTMHLGRRCPGSEIAFPNGFINGAAWYKVKGGMQDFNYFRYSCMELTLEISCCKIPKANELSKYWQDNKKALLHFLMEVYRGIRGVVKDELGTPVANATLQILGRDVPFRTTSNGEFWKILLPHVYLLQVTANGFQDEIVPIEITEASPPKWSQFIIITLHRLDSNRSWSEPTLWTNASTNDEELNIIEEEMNENTFANGPVTSTEDTEASDYPYLFLQEKLGSNGSIMSQTKLSYFVLTSILVWWIKL